MSELKDVVIVSGVRLPVGSFGGSLKDVSTIDMGAMVVKEAVARAGIQPSDVDEVIIATNSSLEGETTAMYISRLIKPTGIKVTRIASGVPVVLPL